MCCSEFAVHGGYRHLLEMPRDVQARIMHYNDYQQPLTRTDVDVLNNVPEPADIPGKPNIYSQLAPLQYPAVLAQSVERTALNRVVVGSSPTVGAYFLLLLKFYLHFGISRLFVAVLFFENHCFFLFCNFSQMADSRHFYWSLVYEAGATRLFVYVN